MTSIVIDDATLAVLQKADGLSEIKDSAGNLVGFFAPRNLENATKLVQVASRCSQAELERRKNSKGKVFTTLEVFKYLQTLTPDPKEKEGLQKKIDEIAERDRCDAR